MFWPMYVCPPSVILLSYEKAATNFSVKLAGYVRVVEKHNQSTFSPFGSLEGAARHTRVDRNQHFILMSSAQVKSASRDKCFHFFSMLLCYSLTFNWGIL